MSYGLSNEALSGCRRTESSTLMDLHFETHLYLHSNNNMYMWNQVNCTQNYYANVGTSAPYNQWSYPLVSCPHLLGSILIPRWKANRCVRQKGRNSLCIQCSYQTAPTKPTYLDTCPPPIPQPSHHAAHYRTILALLLKRRALTGQKGDL
jgi:hypothetical protein